MTWKAVYEVTLDRIKNGYKFLSVSLIESWGLCAFLNPGKLSACFDY